MDRVSEHLSTLTLSALDLGGLDPADRQRAEQHVQQCERCRSLKDSSSRAQADFRARIMPRQLEALPAPRPRWPLGFAMAAAAAMLAVVIARGLGAPAEPDLRIKGDLHLAAVAARGEDQFPVRDGTRLRAGDRVRFVISGVPPGETWALLASVDGRGAISVYFPFGGDRSALLDQAPHLDLPGSVTLDDAPGPERVFAFFSDRPFALAQVQPALARLAQEGPERLRQTAALPDVPLEQRTVCFEKEAP